MRYALGEWLSVHVLCRDTNDDPVAPTAAPTYTIYTNADDSSPTGYDTVTFEPYNQDALTGWFHTVVHLGSGLSTGQHRLLVEWAENGNAHNLLHRFEIVAGGNTSGAYTQLHAQRYPHAEFVIGQTDSGSLELNRSPYLPE